MQRSTTNVVTRTTRADELVKPVKLEGKCVVTVTVPCVIELPSESAQVASDVYVL